MRIMKVLKFDNARSTQYLSGFHPKSTHHLSCLYRDVMTHRHMRGSCVITRESRDSRHKGPAGEAVEIESTTCKDMDGESGVSEFVKYLVEEGFTREVTYVFLG